MLPASSPIPPLAAAGPDLPDAGTPTLGSLDGSLTQLYFGGAE